MRLAVLAAVSALVASASCFASVRHPELARRAYLHAIELQRKLEATPAESRTRAEYERVIREFRDVYFYDFANLKAPVAAEAMGDLYAEMGRVFSSPAYFRAAIKSYQYVISQYPASSMARDSWLSMGKVYLEGLKDPGEAQDTFRSFLAKHPSSAQSGEARKGLEKIAEEAAAEKEQQSRSTRTETVDDSAGRASGSPVEVTEIHDWVGPNYTRVVIGAKGPFKYDTLRLSHPDRIVFDLANTQLDRSLHGKEVRIDGDFLRDIRVGQFKPNVTRVVLDVKNFEDYSAFPLPNPYRLIIDVHGSSPRTVQNASQDETSASHAARVTAQRRSVPAPVEEKTPAVEQVSAIARTEPEVEADKRVEEVAPPRAVAAPRQPVRESVVPKSEVALNRHVPRTAEVARRRLIHRPIERKPRFALDEHIPLAVRQETQIASIEQERPRIPISTTAPSRMGKGPATLTRALGLKVQRIVIDPGHGGFDTGAIGPRGLEEKNVTLSIALRLRKLLETRTNYRVFMTRTTDKFIPLEERTAIATEDHADLFVSIHANASTDHQVRGIATYFLNFTTDPQALQVAARENATSQDSVYQLRSLIKKIALDNKVEESQQLARDIQTALYTRMRRISHGIQNRGVQKAPFVVLIGANIPSVLVETGFITNPLTEHLMREPS